MMALREVLFGAEGGVAGIAVCVSSSLPAVGWASISSICPTEVPISCGSACPIPRTGWTESSNAGSIGCGDCSWLSSCSEGVVGLFSVIVRALRNQQSSSWPIITRNGPKIKSGSLGISVVRGCFRVIVKQSITENLGQLLACAIQSTPHNPHLKIHVALPAAISVVYGSRRFQGSG